MIKLEDAFSIILNKVTRV